MLNILFHPVQSFLNSLMCSDHWQVQEDLKKYREELLLNRIHRDLIEYKVLIYLRD